MLILIAESKTMNTSLRQVPYEEFIRHIPSGEGKAEEIMAHLREAAEEEVGDMLRISPKLAREVSRMIYDFPDKLSGLPAVDAFTGVVFRQLKPSLWSKESRIYADNNLRIVSSLYGLLKPWDIVRPYRLDYSACAAPGGVSLREFWKPACTVELVNLIKREGHREVISLLPAEAAKCFDWKIVKRFARVVSIQIKEPSGGDILRTPPARRLKEIRGRITEAIIGECLKDSCELERLRHPDFICSEYLGDVGSFVFLC